MSEIVRCPECEGGAIRGQNGHDDWYACVNCQGSGKVIKNYSPPEASQSMTDDINDCPFPRID